MLISDKYEFIFVHIYKNAGISITTALMPFAATPGQINLDNFLRKFEVSYLYPLVIKNNSSPQEWASNILNNLYERMTFLSHHPQPVYNHASATEIISKIGKERFDSYFSFGIVRNPWDWQVSLYRFMLESITHPKRKLIMKLGSFDNYIRWRCEVDVRYQKDFLFLENGEQQVDFIGKYENLEADFQEICRHIGISAKLPKLNQSTKNKSYQEYYTAETIELVRKTFAPDIDLFGYDFE